MSLIGLILTLAIFGLIAWAVTTYIPMPGNIKTLIIIVCGIAALLYVLEAFGVLGGVGHVQVPKLR